MCLMFSFTIKTIPKETGDHSLDHLFGFIFPKNRFYLFCHLYFLKFLELKKKKRPQKGQFFQMTIASRFATATSAIQPNLPSTQRNQLPWPCLKEPGRDLDSSSNQAQPLLKEPARPKQLRPRGCLQGPAAQYPR